MSELKVKPCPFCGSDDISFSAFSLSPDAYALCGHCNAGIEIQVGWDEMTEKEHDEVCNHELQKVWNRRSVEQPQLNPNQQLVLEWLKSTWIDRKKNCWFPFEVINSLYYQFDVVWGKVSYEEFKRIEKEKPYIKAYGELTALEQFEVLEVFSRWAQEQEEEKC